mgnify:CR=1 FL=1
MNDPQVADPNSETVILEFNQPYGNHNGGQIAFGPDGYLYIGLGDGGSGGDPMNHAQRRDSLLGKMLRVVAIVPIVTVALTIITAFPVFGEMTAALQEAQQRAPDRFFIVHHENPELRRAPRGVFPPHRIDGARERK